MAGQDAVPRSSPVQKEQYHEKKEIDMVKHSTNDPPSQGTVQELSSSELRALVHRVDRRLIVTAGFMYCVSLIDRTNLGAANIAGMSEDLGLDIGYRYSIIALVFFISYTIFQPVATILCRKIGPRIFLSGITLAWGCTLVGFGFPKSWEQLAGLRVLLGLLEAGFLPGCLYLISTWYTRYDLQKRLSAFYMIGFFSSGLGGILAYGLMHMKGVGGLNGWRWIFIMEGIAECEYIIHSIDADRNDATEEPWNFEAWLSSGKDFLIWGYGLMFFGFTAITYAVAYFLPMILRERMGFSLAASQCLIAPPYFVACIYMYVIAWVSDKYHIRGPIMAINTVVGIVGLCLMGLVQNSGVAYFGVFLISCGFNTNIPACMTYQSNNIRAQWKRAFCSATFVGLGGVGGVAGSLIYRSQDAPGYRPGIYTSIGFAVAILVILCFNTWYFRRENAKADRGEKILQGHPSF
ncbi:hypothetical protein LB504_012939, partial [Fusarium proliferatum]